MLRFCRYKMIALYFLLLHYFIREVEKQGGEKEKSIIQTNNHANLKRYSKSLVAAEREKKKPHHTTCLLPIKCIPREGSWEGPNTCGWKAYLSCL